MEGKEIELVVEGSGLEAGLGVGGFFEAGLDSAGEWDAGK